MSKPNAYLIGSLYLPVDSVPHERIAKELHIIDDKDDKTTSQIKETKMYHYEELSGVMYIAVPRVYGEMYFDDFNIVDWSAVGDEGCLSGLKVLKPRDHQPQFIDRVTELLHDYKDQTASAYTGSGKTVMGIEIARRINTTTLIIVDQVKLGLQWVETLVSIFGMPEDQIGHYSGFSKDYEGKPICIATIQTLYRRGTELDEFYDTFGFTIIDEHHSAGAQKYGTVLMNLSSKYRLGVSATADRRDIFQKVLDYNLGEVGYTMPNNHEASEIWYVNYDRVLSSYANTATQVGTYESALAADGARNLLIANITKQMYDQGRDILVISSRSIQVHSIMALCEALGIPEEDMGVYSQSLYRIGYAKDKEPPYRLSEWDGESVYTPTHYDVHKISSGKVKKELNAKAIKARIIFSTYQMFGKGTDVPRLSVGIDATPRSKVVQAHGRILRVEAGKPTPIWITIRDHNNPRSEHQFMHRLDDYSKSNAKTIRLMDPDGSVSAPLGVEVNRDVTRNMNRLRRMYIANIDNGEYELKPLETR